MAGRTVVELVADGSCGIVEADGELCFCWLPGYELPSRDHWVFLGIA